MKPPGSKRTKAAAKVGVTPTTVRRLVLDLPGVEAGTSYGMPSFKLGAKFFARDEARES